MARCHIFLCIISVCLSLANLSYGKNTSKKDDHKLNAYNNDYMSTVMYNIKLIMDIGTQVFGEIRDAMTSDQSSAYPKTPLSQEKMEKLLLLDRKLLEALELRLKIATRFIGGHFLLKPTPQVPSINSVSESSPPAKQSVKVNRTLEEPRARQQKPTSSDHADSLSRAHSEKNAPVIKQGAAEVQSQIEQADRNSYREKLQSTSSSQAHAKHEHPANSRPEHIEARPNYADNQATEKPTNRGNLEPNWVFELASRLDLKNNEISVSYMADQSVDKVPHDPILKVL